MKEYDLYLFDFDGTLFDSKEALFPIFLDGFKAVGKECSLEEVRSFMTIPLTESARIKGLDENETKTYFETIMLSLDNPDYIKLTKSYSEVERVIKTLLDNGKRIGIVSSNSVNHISLVLKAMSFPYSFSITVGGEMVKHMKPDPESINLALSKCEGIPKDKIIYIGDSINDVKAGQNAFIDTLLVDRENRYPDYKGDKDTTLEILLSPFVS